MARMRVDRCPLFDQGINIRNGDEQTHLPVLHCFYGGQLIQVTGVIVVDGAPRQAAQIPDMGILLHRWTAQSCQLLVNVAVELRLQAPAEHGPRGDRGQAGAVMGQRLAHGVFSGSELAFCTGGGPLGLHVPHI